MLLFNIHIYIYIYTVGGVWVQLLGVKGPVLMIFMFYVNVSGIQPQSCLFSQTLMIPAPWVLFHIKWSIDLFK